MNVNAISDEKRSLHASTTSYSAGDWGPEFDSPLARYWRKWRSALTANSRA
jgi:hypothetical protein